MIMCNALYRSDVHCLTMDLLSEYEIGIISKQFGLTKTTKWYLEEFEEKVIGYLGDHLKLIIEGLKDEVKTELKLFVKCMPRFNKWKSKYLKELNFFYKEFIMLNELFRQFENNKGPEKWRPNLYFIREDLFVFEDVGQLGYVMPDHQEIMTFEELKATVKTVARFHAQSYIFEEKKSKELGRPYRISEDFGEHLQEPERGLDWRNTGRNAVIDFLKEFSKYKSRPDFSKKIEIVIPMLFDGAMALMKPSNEYRNVVVHRDLWTNNILIKKDNSSEPEALIVDFQTVLYSSPMLDLSSLIYFNTVRKYRNEITEQLLNVYHDTLSTALRKAGMNIRCIFPKDFLMKAYNESLMFGMTQAALIVPIVAMSKQKREEIFNNPESNEKANVVSRSEEFIEVAKEDQKYSNRLCELFDEIVEMYVYINGEDNEARD